MTSIQEQVFIQIKANKGISWNNLLEKFKKIDAVTIESAIQKLIKEGLIIFIWEKYYPTVRQISLYEKKQEKHYKDIELQDLTVDEVKSIFTPFPDDPLFFGCYDINKSNADYFTNKYKIEFEFEKYDYFLDAYFDISEENSASNL